MNKNINTSTFWNYQNVNNEKMLSQSKIYRHKHKIVLKWLSGKNKTMLNIGVGNGYLEKLLALKNKSIYLFGIDISDLSIKNIGKDVKGVFKVANITKIPFTDNSFDFITALDILEHLDSKELNKGLNEIRRVLKLNGKLIISVPLNEKVTDKKTNRHLLVFSKKGMLNILKKNNFKVNEVRELFAFQRLYWLKTVVSNLLSIKKPNLLIVKATKSKE